MRFLLTCVLALSLAAVGAVAQQHCYGWENGGTTLGDGYNMQYVYTANTDAEAYEGLHSLEIYESGGTTTPQAYVAWITNLQEGDQVTANVMTLDRTCGSTYPSLRIWAHYTPLDGDIQSYAGSASGPSTYSGYQTPCDVWLPLEYTWTFPGGNDGGGLVIEIRPYNSGSFLGSNWIDNLCITAPEHCWVYFPGGVVATENSSLSGVKALFR